MTATITRTALRYFGGKAALADWIVGHFPPHQSYLEPFGGGASVLLAKERVSVETYNDLNGSVVAFFRALRNSPDDLIRAIHLTPFARAELLAADTEEAGLSDVERGRRLYIRSWQSIHGAPATTSGWRCEKEDGGNAAAFAKTDHLWSLAERLRGVQIEERDALECIERFDRPDCLHFVDPPYVTSIRSKDWRSRGYGHELDDADHRRLAAVLRSVHGAVVLSGYPSPLYAELYAGWTEVVRTARKQSRNDATEVLWLNPAAANAVRQRPLPLDPLEETP